MQIGEAASRAPAVASSGRSSSSLLSLAVSFHTIRQRRWVLHSTAQHSRGAIQPRAISDGAVADRFQASDYISSEDEPWHATCRSNFVGSADILQCVAAPAAAPPPQCQPPPLPHMTTFALRPARSSPSPRPRAHTLPPSPLRASKPPVVLEVEAAEEAKGKKIGGANPGWKNYGENRVLGKTHDNSV